MAVSLSHALMRRSLETIFVMQATEHWFGHDTLTVAEAMTALGWRGPTVSRLREARPQTGMWTSSIVVNNPLRKHALQVALVQRNREIKAFPTDRPDQALTKCVCCGDRTAS